MNKTFASILIILIISFFTNFGQHIFAQESVISEIVIEGNQRVENETIETYVSIDIGDEFDVNKINETVKNIFSSGFFSDVKVSRRKNTLLIKVVENPIINRISFEGNEDIDDESLYDEIRIAPRSVFTKAKIQDEVNRMITIYRRIGRFDAAVNPKIIILPKNRVDIVFEINEGENTSILSINFVGNENFSDRRLRDIIVTRQTRWYSILTATDRYDPDQLSLDREELRKFYLDHGYADFSVESSVAQLSKDKEGFNIIFSIEEGKKYNIQNVSIENLVQGVDTKDVLEQLPLKNGMTYSVNKVEEAIDELTDIILLQGYPFIVVVPEVQRVENKSLINVNLRVNEAEKIYVSRINIKGNDRTEDQVIRRNMRLAEGDAIVSKLISRSHTVIRNLEFFEKVDIKEVPTGNYGFSDLDIEVVEKPTGELSFGGGFSSTAGGLVNFGIRERNFMGKGQSVNLQARLSGRQQTVSAGFLEPYFYNRDVSLGADIYDDIYDYRESRYVLDKTGLSIRSNFALSEYLNQGVGYILETRNLKPETGASSSVIAEKGKTLLSTLNTSFTYDRLDNRLNPTEGFSASANASLAGIGGDKKYVRIINSYKYYIPYNDKQIIFGLTMDAGIAAGLDQDILLSDRFYLGGNNFRGFEQA
ncbi:MAG: Outer membrane protein assembly factor BamA, partial [Alphaproteobacteria bacterium MarineAlpha9_Bin1]